MRKTVLVLVSLVLSTEFAMASEKGQNADKEWNQEPSAVLGIKLGQPVAASQLPTCIKPSPSNSYAIPEELCLYPDEFNMSVQQIGGLPWKKLRIRGDVYLFEGKVKSVHFDVAHGDFHEFSQMLISRYGKPMRISNGAVQSYGGAELSAQTLEWNGGRTLIKAYERYNKVDRSLIVFNDARLLLDSSESSKKNTEEGASHL